MGFFFPFYPTSEFIIYQIQTCKTGQTDPLLQKRKEKVNHLMYCVHPGIQNLVPGADVMMCETYFCGFSVCIILPPTVTSMLVQPASCSWYGTSNHNTSTNSTALRIPGWYRFEFDPVRLVGINKRWQRRSEVGQLAQMSVTISLNFRPDRRDPDRWNDSYELAEDAAGFGSL